MWGWSQSGSAVFGCLPKHLFGLVKSSIPGCYPHYWRKWCGSRGKAGGLRGLKTKPSVWLAVWTEAKARAGEGRGERTERMEWGRDCLQAFWSALWWGQEDAISSGPLSEYPSVYLPVQISVHLLICPVLEVHIIAPSVWMHIPICESCAEFSRDSMYTRNSICTISKKAVIAAKGWLG